MSIGAKTTRLIEICATQQQLAYCEAKARAGELALRTPNVHPAVRRIGQLQAACYGELAQIYRGRLARLTGQA